MVSYVLINNEERNEFEKRFQLPYGCFNTTIYKDISDAVNLLKNMSDFEKRKYYIETWYNGEFKEVILKGEWLIGR